MKIGDKVRFLNQTGGGIVVGFSKKGWVTVEDEDGFEIPVPERECVVVQENAVAQEGKNIQTKDGEKLNVALAYTKLKNPVGGSNEFGCTMANECNFNLLATYTTCNSKGEYITLFAGEILPYEQKELFKFGKRELNEYSKRVLVRLIPYKTGSGLNRTTPHTLKPIIEQEIILDPLNLLKESMFKESEYISEKAYIIPIINENVKELPLSGKEEEQKLKQALKEKFEGEATLGGNNKPQGKNINSNVGKTFVNGKWIENNILEVDLHASELLETTAGMDNTAILKYQLEQFNKTMEAVIRKKGTRIVFIHGKGDGVLRKAILTELKRYNGQK